MLRFFVPVLAAFVLVGCTTKEVPVTPVSPTSTNTPRTIVALGDSLTAGLGTQIVDNYPSQLEAKLKSAGYSYVVQNAGVSWDTSAQLAARTDWVLDGNKPDLAIVEIWGNDAFQGISPDELEKNLRAILQKLKDRKIPTLLTGMKAPLNLGFQYRWAFEEVFPKLAKEFDAPFMPFFLEWVAADPKYNQRDGIHPNKEGYTIIVDSLFAALESNQLIQR